MNYKKNQPIHIWIDDGFPIDKIIKKFSGILFDIDDESRAILSVIAKDGPSSEYQIQKKGYKISHHITREKVRYRLRNAKFLQSFVLSRDDSPHRNTGKIPHFYFLSLKGFLASLAKTQFEEIYLVKKYRKFLSNFTDVDLIPESSLQIVKYGLALFLIENVINGTKLTDTQIMKKHIYDFFNPLHSLNQPVPSQKIDDPELENYLNAIRQRYHVSQLLLIELYIKIGIKTPYYNKKYDLTFLDIIQYWHHYFEEINFKDTERYDPFSDSYPEYEGKTSLDQKLIYRHANRIFKSVGLKPVKYSWMPTLSSMEITR